MEHVILFAIITGVAVLFFLDRVQRKSRNSDGKPGDVNWDKSED